LFGRVQEQDPQKRMEANLPDVPPLSPQELARQEHEALGLYVRYDPLVEYRSRLLRFCTAYSDQLEGLAEGEEVVMGGVVEAVKRRSTRSKETMVVLKVLDARNSFECVLFPRAYEEYGALVQAGSVLFFAGRVSHSRGTSLQADQVIPFDKVQARLAGSVRITVSCQEAGAPLWAALRDLLQEHRGQVPVFIDLVDERFRLRARTGSAAAVDASEQFAAAVEGLVGPGSVQFGIQRNGARAGLGARRGAAR
jgi:DNA polymerase-3 subunit alpha